jgi:organic radical activating enzyme
MEETGTKMQNMINDISTDVNSKDNSKPSAPAAHLMEVFDSIQGEGPYVGVRQIFIRFMGCNLNCLYCDAPETKGHRETCRIEQIPGSWVFVEEPNPFSADKLISMLARFGNPSKYHSLAITGGEPLLHWRFLQNWLPLVKQAQWDIYLETSGELHDNMLPVAAYIRYCAMDMKLPSATGEKEMWDDHRLFLRLCRENHIETFVKTVVGKDTPEEEVLRAAEIVQAEYPEIPLILQPVTPFGTVKEGPGIVKMLALQRSASDFLADVRIIPQTHKILGVL